MAITESTTGPEQNAEPAASFDKESSTGTLEAAIEAECKRLTAAESVLACLQIALDPQTAKTLPAPNFSEVVGVAREHVNETIRRLEEFRGLIASVSPCPDPLKVTAPQEVEWVEEVVPFAKAHPDRSAAGRRLSY